MLVSKKVKSVRLAEGLSQSQFCKIVNIPVSTLKNIEGNHSVPNWNTLTSITKHPRFKKYALWLTTDETAPEVGQIAPPLSLDGYGHSEEDQASTETDQKSHR